MPGAKDITVRPISSGDARAIVARYHYSGKIVNNSQLHFGVFMDGRCEGAMSFGPPLDKRKVIGLVRDTKWNGFLELNRMAFSDRLPRNSESRALAIAFRAIRKQYPHVEWIISFADGTQSGDGAIYRATGFALTGYSKGSMWLLPEDLVKLNDGPVAHRLKVQDKSNPLSYHILGKTRGKNMSMEGYARTFGGSVMPGYQFRYVFFLNAVARERLTVPVLDYRKIKELDAEMYRGKKIKRVENIESDASACRPSEGGASPTSTLQGLEHGNAIGKEQGRTSAA